MALSRTRPHNYRADPVTGTPSMEFTTVVVITPPAPAGGRPGTAPITRFMCPPRGLVALWRTPNGGNYFEPGGGRVLLVEQTLQRCWTQSHLNRRGSSEQARCSFGRVVSLCVHTESTSPGLPARVPRGRTRPPRRHRLRTRPPVYQRRRVHRSFAGSPATAPWHRGVDHPDDAIHLRHEVGDAGSAGPGIRSALAAERRRPEQLSIPVDQDLLCGLLGSGGVVGPFDEFAVLELRAGADECHEMGRVDRPPA